MNAKTMASSAVILVTSGSKYEFIFTCHEQHFVESLEDVLKMYKKSKPYHDTIFRSADLISNGSVLITKKESVFEKIPGVFHLSSEVGTIGNLVITNVRMVWYSSESLSNLNIPYFQMVIIV